MNESSMYKPCRASCIKYFHLILGLVVLFVAKGSAADPRFEKISEHVFLFRDTVNVYLIKEGNRGILVDFGSGRALDRLEELGVDKIDWIFHTHHHRDQCQGDHLALEKGIPVAVPKKEAWLFEDAEKFWQEVPLHDVYFFKPTTFTPTGRIPVARKLDKTSSVFWRGHDLKIIETPGHTHGSISIILNIDNKRLAFTGDLIHSGGKVLTFYDLIYKYNDNGSTGMDLTEKSLETLMMESPDILLSSHGPAVDNPEEAVRRLKGRFEKIREAFVFSFIKSDIGKPHALPHLWHYGSSYFVVSDSGRCLVIDYAGVETEHLAGDETLKRIQRKAKVSSFDIVIPTHYHDDHIGGIPRLVKEHNTKVYVFNNMVDILEHPARYHMAALFGFPVQADLVILNEETFRWENYSFKVFHFPGQTEFHAAIAAEIDEKKIVFAGDSFFPTEPLRGENFNGLNWCILGEEAGYIKCAKKLKELKPDYVALSHFGLVAMNEKKLDEWLAWTRSLKEVIASVVAQDNVNFGADPNWTVFYPYRIEAGPGQRIKTSVEIRNYLGVSAPVKVSLVVPEGWRVEPKSRSAELKAGEFSRLPFSVALPEEMPSGRTVITADIIFQGEHLGQRAEMIIDHGFTFDSWSPGTGLDPWAYNDFNASPRWLKASFIR